MSESSTNAVSICFLQRVHTLFQTQHKITFIHNSVIHKLLSVHVVELL